MELASKLLSVTVPRYTSYPTAPNFHDGVGAPQYCEWLRSLPGDCPLSLYFHIPFCDTLCWFCGCHTSVVNSHAPVEEYRALLLKEVALVARTLGRRHTVSHIHWGGGSPTILATDDIARLSAAIRTNFDVLGDADFAVEIDPRGLGHDAVKAFRAAGMTRASLGLQDCDPVVQRAINRIQSDKETASAVDLLRGVGIPSLNLDLVYGLPYQTPASWERTLRFALQLDPDRLAVFGYAHVPQIKKHQALIPSEALPDTDLRFRLAEMARQTLCAHGYIAVGLDHFAKPCDPLARAAATKTVSRNFQGYTTDTAQTLIGFGVSAIGSLPQGYIQNAPRVPSYRDAIATGQLPAVRGVMLTDDDRMRREIIESLMCELTVDLSVVALRHRRPATDFSKEIEELTPLVQCGAVAISGTVVSIASSWRSAVRLVCAAFDQYLPRHRPRHSLAV